MRPQFKPLIVVLAVSMIAPNFLHAEATRKQRQQIVQVKRGIQAANLLYKRKKYRDSAKVIKEVHKIYDELIKDNDKQVVALLSTTTKRLTNLRALLELEGVKLPPLRKPGEKPKKGTGTISFSKQIAPLLVTKCGRCHVNRASGRFSMSNFENLMKGTPQGVVVDPKDIEGSRIVEVITSGDMPRGGGKVSAEELKLLKTWIKEGAKYDGRNKMEMLTRLVPNARAARGPRIAVSKSTGKETVSFSRDIAPVLVQNCTGCHGDGRRARGRFNLTNIRQMFRGGESGAPVLPGKAKESLLFQKLTGKAGRTMPLGRKPLSSSILAKIEKWIAEGATFDGPEEGMHVERVAAIYRAKHATHAELSDDRITLAKQNWQLGMPNIEFTRLETKNLLVMGNVGKNTTKLLANRAEKLVPQIATLLKAPSGKPLVKGRVSLFLVKSRYDYSEFGNMVEKREVPRTIFGHWKYNITDAYAVMIPPRRDEFSVDALLAQQISGAYLGSLGAPDWFAEGAARVVATKIKPVKTTSGRKRTPRSRKKSADKRMDKWTNELPDVLVKMDKPEDFLKGKLRPDRAAIVSYSYVNFLMRDSRRFGSLLGQLRKGKEFKRAFPAAYGGSPTQVTTVWARAIQRDIRRILQKRKREARRKKKDDFDLD